MLSTTLAPWMRKESYGPSGHDLDPSLNGRLFIHARALDVPGSVVVDTPLSNLRASTKAGAQVARVALAVGRPQSCASHRAHCAQIEQNLRSSAGLSQFCSCCGGAGNQTESCPPRVRRSRGILPAPGSPLAASRVDDHPNRPRSQPRNIVDEDRDHAERVEIGATLPLSPA